MGFRTWTVLKPGYKVDGPAGRYRTYCAFAVRLLKSISRIGKELLDGDCCHQLWVEGMKLVKTSKKSKLRFLVKFCYGQSNKLLRVKKYTYDQAVWGRIPASVVRKGSVGDSDPSPFLPCMLDFVKHFFCTY